MFHSSGTLHYFKNDSEACWCQHRIQLIQTIESGEIINVTNSLELDNNNIIFQYYFIILLQSLKKILSYDVMKCSLERVPHYFNRDFNHGALRCQNRNQMLQNMETGHELMRAW